ncbi:hypothetical protein U1Q18_003056 [Sarracenia purpurea var. burkii]
MDTEKDSWPHSPKGLFPASHDTHSNKEATSLASDNTKISNHCFKRSNIDTVGTELCADDRIIGERCNEVDSNSYHYSLGDISQTDNLTFLDNEQEDKESNDLLYYGWPDIGNFEDVDRIFRSCDSTFGIGVVDNEEEINWLTLSDMIEGYDDVLKSDFRFSILETSPFQKTTDQHEPSKYFSVDDSNMYGSSVSHKSCFRVSGGAEPNALGHFTFLDGSNSISESKDEFAPKEQIDSHKEAAKHHNKSEGKRKEQCLEKGRLFFHTGNIHFKDTKLPSGDSSSEAFTSPRILKQKENIGHDSLGYLQTHVPHMHLDYHCSSDQIPVSSSHSALSPKECSYALNQVQSMETSHDCSFEHPAMMVDDKRENLHHQQGSHPSFSINPNCMDFVVHTASCDPISVLKCAHHSQNEVKNHNEVGAVSIKTPADLDCSNAHENSCMSSGLDEVSSEAASFHQLQQVMEQLDIRTKLCIRDSLYRLARSAEQRHHYANLNSRSIDDGDTDGGLMAEGTNNCDRFMEVETGTNPIDRSIAHLLFHRLTGSRMPAHDGLSLTA